MQIWALVGIGAATALAITGAVIYHFEQERRMELILARRRV
jgi:hypothetical protein